MRIRIFALWVAVCGTVFTTVTADDPQRPLPIRTVGSVYGKVVDTKDIGLTETIDTSLKFDARDSARWQQMGRIQKAFGGPVLDRFVKQKRIEATADEIKKFQSTFRKKTEGKLREGEANLLELKRKLMAPDVSNEDKAKIMEELSTYDQHVATLREALARDVPESIARTVIVAWKTERELYRQYGGRAIFQQFGIEALDARRRLFEEAEKKGDIKFDDNGVRHLFYYYSNMKHTFIDKEKAARMFEQPWFFNDET
jgi:hypothetical protein